MTFDNRAINQLRQQVNQLILSRQPEQLDLALEYLQQWQGLQPQQFEPLQRQVEILLHQKNPQAAARILESWTTSGSTQPEVAYYSGVLAQLNGLIPAAMDHYAAAIHSQRLQSRLPTLKGAEMQVAAAIQLCETAAGNYPGSPGKSDEGMFGFETEMQLLENTLLNWEKDPECSDPSEEVRQKHANAWYNLGCAALAAFTADDRRIRFFEKAVELHPENLLAQFNHAFAHNYSFEKSPVEIFQAHLRAANWLERGQSAAPGNIRPYRPSAGRLKLAYLSSDFRQHSVAHFILPVLQHHNRERFEVFVYHTHAHSDELTRKARLHADHFRSLGELSDEQLIKQARQDQVDVLIDLNGLTNGHRLSALAQRLAPLQLSWIGYPNTTGLRQMDFRIVDELTDPVGESEQSCTEALLRLPHPFLCFEPLEESPAEGELPCLRNGFITLGSFNALPKLNPPLLKQWADIMQVLPGSRLLIKNPGMDFEFPRAQIRGELENHGISRERLIFAGKNATQAEHLEHYRQVDISLDSFPYNGTTTTCDSLWMGVPVVSMAGHDHRSRVGFSLLSSLGLESLVASDENSLRGIVTGLAANSDRLRELRANLRSRLKQSPLMDAARLTAHLETELLNAWRRLPANTSHT